jgi:hypothetical protein
MSILAWDNVFPRTPYFLIKKSLKYVRCHTGQGSGIHVRRYYTWIPDPGLE